MDALRLPVVTGKVHQLGASAAPCFPRPAPSQPGSGSASRFTSAAQSKLRRFEVELRSAMALLGHGGGEITRYRKCRWSVPTAAASRLSITLSASSVSAAPLSATAMHCLLLPACGSRGSRTMPSVRREMHSRRLSTLLCNPRLHGRGSPASVAFRSVSAARPSRLRLRLQAM